MATTVSYVICFTVEWASGTEKYEMFFKLAIPGLFIFIFVFSNKHYNSYIKYMRSRKIWRFLRSECFRYNETKTITTMASLWWLSKLSNEASWAIFKSRHFVCPRHETFVILPYFCCSPYSLRYRSFSWTFFFCPVFLQLHIPKGYCTYASGQQGLFYCCLTELLFLAFIAF